MPLLVHLYFVSRRENLHLTGTQELVRRIRRAYAARGRRPDSKTALTKGPLESMLAACIDGLIGLRDRAALLFAFASGGRRRSEVAVAVMENLVKVDDQTYVYPCHTRSPSKRAPSTTRMRISRSSARRPRR